MDLNREYAAHQRALIHADHAIGQADRTAHLARATGIAGRISTFQQGLGAAAACAWSMAHFAAADSI